MDSFLSHIQLFDLDRGQLIFTILIFIWSGFVRSGLGFGGAALSLPLLLLISDRPLFWLPIIGLHLLFFSALTLRNRFSHVDWLVLRDTAGFIFPAKLAGVFGLLSLPNQWLVIIIYGITLFYALLWMIDLRIHSDNGWTDKLLLVMGGYFSGTSLTGAPLMAAVYAHKTKPEQLRDTLFVLWFILVSIKITTLAAFDINLQILSALCLIPIAAIGHLIGLKVHQCILKNDKLFKRVIGAVLIIICSIGLASLLI
ncbi:MAG: TSUP family transporter [Gammaproteobacteria bacterium]|nr:TSUP family transporter [Gammaproteobacteria bacterium]